jgi:16S rRNA (cytosine967-C5)-methyltransferase
MEKVTKNISENEKPYNIRLIAVRILNRFDRSDSYIDKLLAGELKNPDMIPIDKSLLTELINGVIRWRGKLDWVLTGFYHGDYLKCLNLIKNSLRIGLYQLMFLDKIPPHAAINETVDIVKHIQGQKTANVVNGVLRTIQRNINNIRYPNKSEDELYHIAVMQSHPKWMVVRWVKQFGLEDTKKLLEINNKKPYVPIRVNTLKSSVEEIESIFQEHKMVYEKTPYAPNSILVLSPKYDLTQTDFFTEGKIAIQDPSASIAAGLTNAKEDQKVMDLCAAPGGKSFYISELMNGKGEVLAIDKYEAKLRFIDIGAQRLGFENIKTLAKDASKVKLDYDPDIIFADVPCSGTGTIRKKPDIKWKKEIDNIREMVPIQRKILTNAVNLIGDNGVIVYSTCSLEDEENFGNVKWFLENFPEFKLDPAENYVDKELCKDGCMQILPHKHQIDGAFAARFIKTQ